MPTFHAIPTRHAAAFRAGRPDALGNVPERKTSDGAGNPCRHCLRLIPKGAEMLVLAYQPFEGSHAYAEVGPIFLCASECARGGGTEQPPILTTSPDYLIKGYSADERIVYGTGAVVLADRMHARIAEIFADPNVAQIHVRSARNNCYQARVTRD
ncbi:MAG: DUF1203 domain-containing protein [Pseudomonadota bacterium]